MHIQQTKVGSRDTGGPQYWLQTLTPVVREYLRRHRVCPVVLRTPYGIATSQFVAVDRDCKLQGRKIVRANAQHDRIQSLGRESIGEAIRRWYGLKTEVDFERIDIDVELHPEGHFIVSPVKVAMRGGRRTQELEKAILPLTFTSDHQSRLWRRQIDAVRAANPKAVDWAGKEILRVVEDHLERKPANIHEADLLRAGGALSKLGMHLGPYLVRSYDCDPSHFQFRNLPEYPCPVEVKKFSKGFKYQILRYKPLPRAVILCIKHDLLNPPGDIDVVELFSLAQYLGR